MMRGRLSRPWTWLVAMAVVPALDIAAQESVPMPERTLGQLAALMERVDTSQAAVDQEIRRVSVNSDARLPESAATDQAHEEMILQRLRREGAGLRATGLQRTPSDPQATEAELARKADEGGAYEADPRTRKQYLNRLMKDKKQLQKYQESLRKMEAECKAQTERGALTAKTQNRAQEQIGEVQHFLDALDGMLAQNPSPPAEAPAEAAPEPNQKN